jgi:PmbA protein
MQTKLVTQQANTQTQLMDAVQFAVAQAKHAGISHFEITANTAVGFNINVRLGEVETLEYNRDKVLAITVYSGQCKGSTSTTETSHAAINTSLQKAISIAEKTQPDPYAGLADREFMANDYLDLDLYHPWDIVPTQAIEVAKECEAIAMAMDPRIKNSEGVSVATADHYHVYTNSHGFIGHFNTSMHSIDCTLVAEQNNHKERDYSYTTARDAKALFTIHTLAKEAAQRTLGRLGARKLTTRHMPVIFSAEVARGLLGNFLNAISGSQLYRQASFLLDHLEKPLFPDFVHISQQPHQPKVIGSAPFDQEGVRTYAHDLIAGGILKNYILSSYSARKLAMQTTGSAGGAHNVIVQPGSQNLTALLKQMDTGLLVTELLGHGVNIVTGDYSRGAAGYWIEKGEIAYPVHEITVAGNLRDIFKNIVAIGNDIDLRGNVKTGSILISEMTIAGE